MSRIPAPARLDRGQVLVIFTGGLVLLLAIAALVIDLGFAFMIRRQEQNAADPGAIAAARYLEVGGATQTDMVNAACFYARENGFFGGPSSTLPCLPANDPNGTVLTVNHPPSAAAGDFQGRSDMVEVILRRPHHTFLGNVVGIRTVVISSSAVAAFGSGNANSNSLVALDPTDNCAAGMISGNNTAVTITASIDPSTGLPFEGGYVHVNSTCSTGLPNTSCENSGSGALQISSNGSSLSAPHVYVSGTCVKSNLNTFSAPLTEGAVQIGDPLADVPEPQISDYPAGRCGPTGVITTPTGPDHKGCTFPSGVTELDPGVYYGGWRIGNGEQIRLAPGIYIIAGGGITLTGTGSLESVSGDPTIDARVLIFSTDNPAAASCASMDSFERQGPLDFTANSTFNAKGLSSGPWRGMLLWQDGDGCNSSANVSLGGQTNLNIAGTIYAPNSLVTLTGGSAGTGVATVQIISYQWKIDGTATLTMPYDPRELYQLQQKGLVR